MPFSSEPKEGHPGSVLRFPDISPTTSIVSPHGSVHLCHARDHQCQGERQRSQKGQTCSYLSPGSLPGAHPGAETWTHQGMEYIGFFCLPRCPCTGLSRAPPAVFTQGSPAGFATLKMRSWEEARKQWSWMEVLRQDRQAEWSGEMCGHNCYFWQGNVPLLLCSWQYPLSHPSQSVFALPSPGTGKSCGGTEAILFGVSCFGCTWFLPGFCMI